MASPATPCRASLQRQARLTIVFAGLTQIPNHTLCSARNELRGRKVCEPGPQHANAGGIAAFSPTHYSSGETCVKAFHRFCVNDTCWQQVKDTRLDPSTNSLGHSYIKSCTVLGLSYGYAGVYLFTVPGCNRGAAAKLCSSCVCACLLHAACGRLFGSLRVCWA